MWFWIWYSWPAGLIHLCSHASYGQKSDVPQLFYALNLCQCRMQGWMFLFDKLCVVWWQQRAVPHMRCELQTQVWAPIPRLAPAGPYRGTGDRYCRAKGGPPGHFGSSTDVLQMVLYPDLWKKDDLLKTVLQEASLGTEVRNKRTGICTSSNLHLLHMKGHYMLYW